MFVFGWVCIFSDGLLGTNVGCSGVEGNVFQVLDWGFVVFGIKSLSRSLIVIGVQEWTNYRQPR